MLRHYPYIIGIAFLLCAASCTGSLEYTKLPTRALTMNSINILCARIVEFKAQNGRFPESYIEIRDELTHGLPDYSAVITTIDKPRPFYFMPKDNTYISNGMLPGGLIYLKFRYNGDKSGYNYGEDYFGFAILVPWDWSELTWPHHRESFRKLFRDSMDWNAFIYAKDKTKLDPGIFEPDGEVDPIEYKFEYYVNYPYDDIDNVVIEWS